MKGISMKGYIETKVFYAWMDDAPVLMTLFL